VIDVAWPVLGGALLGGLVSGLTGFGTGLVALPVWLQVLSPLQAAPLVMICSVVSQAQTLPAIWHAMDWRRMAPYLAGGALGVPIGVLCLPHVALGTFKLGLGLLLVLVCSVLLLGSGRLYIRHTGRWADVLVGLGGGLLGGLAGLSGPLPTVWASLHQWGKDERRAVFQGFNSCVLLLAFVAQAASGALTVQVGWLALSALPGTVLGVWAGRRLYGRLNADRFNQLVQSLLLVAGVALIVQAW
jgi:uncharacterized protein